MSYHSLLSAFHWKPYAQKDSPQGLLRELRAIKRSKELREGEGPGPALGLRGQEARAAHRGGKPRRRRKSVRLLTCSCSLGAESHQSLGRGREQGGGRVNWAGAKTPAEREPRAARSRLGWEQGASWGEASLRSDCLLQTGPEARRRDEFPHVPVLG